MDGCGLSSPVELPAILPGSNPTSGHMGTKLVSLFCLNGVMSHSLEYFGGSR